VSPIILASFFLLVALLAVLIWWLRRSKKFKALDALISVGGILFGISSLWRAFRALEDGHISMSRVVNGVFHRASETHDFWIWTLFFSGFGIVAISISMLILLDLLRLDIKSRNT
jgi:hypothetical protein